MPRPSRGQPSEAIAAVGSAIYSPVAERLRDHPGPIFPLHVGDTWMEPFAGGRMEDLREADHPGLHRYCATGGIAPLVDALMEKLRSRNGLACERDQVLVTGGATGGLACAVSALADPGEEVLILAPFWPLIRGIVRSQRAVPVEVPFYDRMDRELGSPEAAVEALEARLSDRSVALYVSTPSNPTGRVLPAAWLEALAEWARRRDLWLLSDEVYEAFVYRGEHVSLGTLAPERTVSAFSFSKTYGTAGNRVGYLSGPAEMLAQAHKVGIHSFYHAPTAGQWAALAALRQGDAWVAEAREAYRKAGEDAAATLGVPAPEGSCFLFLDVADRLDERGLLGLLEDCAEEGVVLAPGTSSGEAYGSSVRLCYTAAPPEAVAEATRLLARRLQG